MNKFPLFKSITPYGAASDTKPHSGHEFFMAGPEHLRAIFLASTLKPLYAGLFFPIPFYRKSSHDLLFTPAEKP